MGVFSGYDLWLHKNIEIRQISWRRFFEAF